MFITLQKKHVSLKKFTISTLSIFATGIIGILLLMYSIQSRDQLVEDLYAENNLLKLELNSSAELERQNEILETFMTSAEAFSEQSYIVAKVIYSDLANIFQTILINKGSEDGIYSGMNVISDGALVGIVTKTFSHMAYVDTLLNSELQIDALHVQSGNHAIINYNQTQSSAKTNYKNMIKAQWLQYNTVVGYHDMLITANTSDKFLPGLLIGYINSSVKNEEQFTLNSEIRPAADLLKLEYVLVLTEMKELP